MLVLHHLLLQIFLLVREQGMNLAMRFVADGMNLRAESLSRGCRILIKQRLNFVVVFLKQNLDLLLLLRRQFEIFRQLSEFLID
jgi:hypothetical protein